MFISEKIIFLELHKTGCTHIRNLLMDHVGGRLEGKHNQATADLLSTRPFVLGSVRNPWEWYVSLWSYGCDNRGAVFERATTSVRIRGHGWRTHPLRALRSLYNDLRRDTEKWRHFYSNPGDASAFDGWLRAVLSTESLRNLPLPYGSRNIARFAGLMSYRYVNLFCHKRGIDSVRDFGTLIDHANRNCFITHFIRNESLAADLIAALRACDVAVGMRHEQAILGASKSNPSSRKLPTASLYTPDTAALVAEKERLIVERFGYRSPLQKPPGP